jgi:predicted RNase H-like HicB family nuclease
MKIKVLVHEAEEGGYWGEVPALPGCASQGETVEELLGNLREAIEGWLATDAYEGIHPTPGGKVLELQL